MIHDSITKLALITIASLSSFQKETYGFVVIKSELFTKSSTTSLAAKKKKSNDPILREEWAMDIASLGGDPSFLPDGYNDEDEWYSDAVEEEEEGVSMPSMSLLGVAGVPSVLNAVDRFGADKDSGDDGDESEEESDFEWDGFENENAHFD